MNTKNSLLFLTVGVVLLAVLFWVIPFIVLGGSQFLDQMNYSEKKTVTAVEGILLERYGEPFTVDRKSVRYVNALQRADLRAHPDNDPQLTLRVEVLFRGKLPEYRDDYMLNSAVNQILQRFCENDRCWAQATFDDYDTYTKEDLEHFDVNRLKDDEALRYLQENPLRLSVHTYQNVENKANPLDFAGMYQFILYLKTQQIDIPVMRIHIPDAPTDKRQQEMYKQGIANEQNSSRSINDMESGGIDIPVQEIASENDLIRALKGVR